MNIYFDATDHDMDGHGWNIVDPDDIGGIAARFRTQREAEAWMSLNIIRNAKRDLGARIERRGDR